MTRSVTVIGIVLTTADEMKMLEEFVTNTSDCMSIKIHKSIPLFLRRLVPHQSTYWHTEFLNSVKPFFQLSFESFGWRLVSRFPEFFGSLEIERAPLLSRTYLNCLNYTFQFFGQNKFWFFYLGRISIVFLHLIISKNLFW